MRDRRTVDVKWHIPVFYKGRKEEYVALLKNYQSVVPDFDGVNGCHLKDAGIRPEVREEWMRHDRGRSKRPGGGDRVREAGGWLDITILLTLEERGIKLAKTEVGIGGGGGWLMSFTLLAKQVKK